MSSCVTSGGRLPTQAVNGGPAGAVAFDPCVWCTTSTTPGTKTTPTGSAAWHFGFLGLLVERFQGKKVKKVSQFGVLMPLKSFLWSFYLCPFQLPRPSPVLWYGWLHGRNVHYIQEVPRCVLLFVMQALQIKKSFITQYIQSMSTYKIISYVILNIILLPVVTLSLPIMWGMALWWAWVGLSYFVFHCHMY